MSDDEPDRQIPGEVTDIESNRDEDERGDEFVFTTESPHSSDEETNEEESNE